MNLNITNDSSMEIDGENFYITKTNDNSNNYEHIDDYMDIDFTLYDVDNNVHFHTKNTKANFWDKDTIGNMFSSQDNITSHKVIGDPIVLGSSPGITEWHSVNFNNIGVQLNPVKYHGLGNYLY